jgi:thiamine-monophosphate kinase
LFSLDLRARGAISTLPNSRVALDGAGRDTPISAIGERALLRHLAQRIPLGPGVRIGPGDDAAVVETGALTVITTDSMVEGVHFRREWSPPELIGRKALSVNVSDVAAMAAAARYATVSLCLTPQTTLGFVDALYDGLLGRASECGVALVGGNLAASESALVVDVTLLGAADRLLLRSGAQPGDLVVVTGRLGASAAGLQCLRGGARIDAEGRLVSMGQWSEALAEPVRHCLRAHLDPEPPIALGRALAEHDLAHAAMDLSDGLSADLLTLCEASGASAWVEPDGVPVDPAAAALEKEGMRDGFSLALHGGEDYQLLLAVPRENVPALRELAAVWTLPISVVGEFAPGPPGVSLRFGASLKRLKPRGHDHFADPQASAAEPGPEA